MTLCMMTSLLVQQPAAWLCLQGWCAQVVSVMPAAGAHPHLPVSAAGAQSQDVGRRVRLHARGLHQGVPHLVSERRARLARGTCMMHHHSTAPGHTQASAGLHCTLCSCCPLKPQYPPPPPPPACLQARLHPGASPGPVAAHDGHALHHRVPAARHLPGLAGGGFLPGARAAGDGDPAGQGVGRSCLPGTS